MKRSFVALSTLALASCVTGSSPNGVRACEVGGDAGEGSGTVVIRSESGNPVLTFELLEDDKLIPIRETISGGASRTHLLAAGSWTFTVVERNLVQRFEVVKCEEITLIIQE